MTALEIVLIAIIWIGYGLYAVSKTKISRMDRGIEIFIILLAPIVFLYRAFRGITAEYVKE